MIYFIWDITFEILYTIFMAFNIDVKSLVI